jgi:hypothetical protein
VLHVESLVGEGRTILTRARLALRKRIGAER